MAESETQYHRYSPEEAKRAAMDLRQSILCGAVQAEPGTVEVLDLETGQVIWPKPAPEAPPTQK